MTSNNKANNPFSKLKGPKEIGLVLSLVSGVLLIGAVIMINIGSASLFTRVDLTENGLYSLSPTSIDAVSSLREPLTIRAFFTPNLPAPYNTVEQTVRDLLDEYAVHGGDLFNYQFINMGEESGEDKVLANEDLARRYLIYPIQIEQLDRDEVTLSTAFTGLALIHGDLIETIPSITSTEQIELSITEAIIKITERVSRLLSLNENIQLSLYYSSKLSELGVSWDQLPKEIEDVVKELKASYFDRLDFEYIDTEIVPLSIDEATELRLTPLSLKQEDGADKLVYAGITVQSGETVITMNLLQTGLLGYQLADSDTIRRSIDDTLKNILGTQEEIGYLADFDTPPYRGRVNSPPSDVVEAELSNLYELLSSDYSYKGLLLENKRIPESLRSLLVVAPQQKLNDWALFQIDQFLMRGGSLIVFLDSHNIYVNQGGGFGGGGAFYLPRETGLEQLIEHYGIKLKQSYVLDEQSFVQRQPSPRGGFIESEIYFAPLLKEDQIKNDLPFLKNLEELVMLNISPLETTESQGGVNHTKVLISSSTAWEMSGKIDLMSAVPPSENERDEFLLAVLSEGTFGSYFAEKEIPQQPKEESSSTQDLVSAEELEVTQNFIPEGNGKIFVLGTSAILGSGFIDSRARNGNSLFILNLIDFMNGRDDRALMRSKGKRIRPLMEITAPARTIIKTIAVAGLPAIIVVIGILVWLFNSARKRRIYFLYNKSTDVGKVIDSNSGDNS